MRAPATCEAARLRGCEAARLRGCERKRAEPGFLPRPGGDRDAQRGAAFARCRACSPIAATALPRVARALSACAALGSSTLFVPNGPCTGGFQTRPRGVAPGSRLSAFGPRPSRTRPGDEGVSRPTKVSRSVGARHAGHPKKRLAFFGDHDSPCFHILCCAYQGDACVAPTKVLSYRGARSCAEPGIHNHNRCSDDGCCPRKSTPPWGYGCRARRQVGMPTCSAPE